MNSFLKRNPIFSHSLGLQIERRGGDLEASSLWYDQIADLCTSTLPVGPEHTTGEESEVRQLVCFGLHFDHHQGAN